jgi:hypothetical protein
MIERGLEAEPQNAELLRMRGEHQQLLAEARAASARAAADRAAREEQERQSNPLKRAWNNIFGQ